MSKDLQPLWQIESELETLLNSLETCPPELQGELEQKVREYVGREAEKIDRVNAVLSSFDAVAANAKTEIARLRDRQQSAERAFERLAQYVLRVINEHGGRPLRGHNVTFSIRRSEALVVDDPAAVPAEWKRITIDVPKDPIKRALKAGEEVPGVHLEQRDNLQRK